VFSVYSSFFSARRNETIRPLCPGCRERDAEIAKLRERLGQLEQRLAEVERAGHRQASPFRRPEKQRKADADKRRPGREPGHSGSYRPRPPVVDESVQVPLERCPHCRGPVTDVQSVEQVIEDIPEVRIRRLRLTTYKGRCACCGLVRSTHPEQVSTAVGAAGTHLAPQSTFLANIRRFFNTALTLYRIRDVMAEAEYGLRVGYLQQRLDELLAPTYWLRDEERIANRLRKQRPQLLTFLERWDVEPTNNRAERELRPAVITRKLSCGNKTHNGKFAFEVLASLAATSRLQGRRFTDLVSRGVALGLSPPPLFTGS